jgi:hypothetical protein
MSKKLFLLLLLSISLQLKSQKKEEKSKKWNVNTPHKDWKYNTFNLNTTEGTWMNLDISPDGKTIGLNFFKPIDEIEDPNEFDIPLHQVIYPK